MRKTLLASATLFGVVVTAPALTQTTVTPPTAPGSSNTASPASPNGEPVIGKPTGSGSAPGAGTTGGTVDTKAMAPKSATSTAPAPDGTTQEQTTGQPANNKHVEHGPAASETRPHRQATRPSRPELMHASTIKSHRCSLAAPHSTTFSADENASVDQHLRDVQTALRGRCIGEAQEALEQAETRALNSAPDTNAGQDSTVNTIERAREALGHARYLQPDLTRGGQLVDQAMSETASKSTNSRSGGQSGSTDSTNGSASPRM